MPAAGTPRTRGPFKTLDELVADFRKDPDLTAVATGTILPSPLQSTALKRRVDIDVVTEGRDTATYAGLEDVGAIVAINDPVVTFAAINNATQLPNSTPGVDLAGGRNKGAALALPPDSEDVPLLELVPAPGARGKLSVTITRDTSTIDNSTAVFSLTIMVDGEVTESYSNLTMDPDDVNYLPAVLSASGLIRAHDLIARSRTTSLPSNMARPKPLTGGTSPLVDEYVDALERLESEESVDVVIGSAAAQLDDAGVLAVHQAVAAHCDQDGRRGAQPDRHRLGHAIGDSDPNKIVDHANDVRSDHFILTAPTGMEGAMAGLLGLQDYFQSPTFKTVAAAGRRRRAAIPTRSSKS